VIGVPDDRYGEELMAWVRLRPGAAELTAEAVREFCAGKLAHYKIPRYVRVVDEFPMTVTGKIRKVEMRGVRSSCSACTRLPRNSTRRRYQSRVSLDLWILLSPVDGRRHTFAFSARLVTCRRGGWIMSVMAVGWYVEVAKAIGEQTVTVQRPYEVSLCPADLMGG
jgi:hypothetical protein